ncbi:MAG: hypothetical protein QM651_15130 [Rhodoblastus sp.]
MPTVDEDGPRYIRPWNSAADQARARADQQKRALDYVKGLYDGAMTESIAAQRAARAAMNTPDFDRLFLRAKGLHLSASIAEAAYKKAYAAWHELDRAARRLERRDDRPEIRAGRSSNWPTRPACSSTSAATRSTSSNPPSPAAARNSRSPPCRCAARACRPRKPSPAR